MAAGMNNDADWQNLDAETTIALLGEAIRIHASRLGPPRTTKGEIMADSSPLLTPAAIEAVARDAGTILLDRRWWVEDELLLRLLTDAGHSRTLADLSLKWLVQHQFAITGFRDKHRYFCYKGTAALRKWCSNARTRPTKGEIMAAPSLPQLPADCYPLLEYLRAAPSAFYVCY